MCFFYKSNDYFSLKISTTFRVLFLYYLGVLPGFYGSKCFEVYEFSASSGCFGRNAIVKIGFREG